MSNNDRAVLVGVLAVVTLAGIGAAVQMIPWLRDNRTEISLFLLITLLVASGFTAALGLLTTYADRPTPTDIDTDADVDMVDVNGRDQR